MMRWMKARKYRFVRPSILSMLTASLVAQVCYAPQLFAMESRERFNEIHRQQYEREQRLRVEGDSHHERVKQVRDHISALALAASSESSPSIVDRQDVGYLRDALSREISRFTRETGQMRQAIRARQLSPVLVQRIDDYIDRKQSEYMELSRTLARLESASRASPEDSRAMMRDLHESMREAQQQLHPEADRAPGSRAFPRRQSTPTTYEISQAPVFQYPWRIASAAQSMDTIGNLFNGIADAGVTEDTDPENEDLDYSTGELGVEGSDDFLDFVRGDQDGQLGGDPVRIFEFVRNTIVYEPYFGSMKNAERTLREGRGSDLDQAILLVAMLRVAGVPARFAYGTISVDLEDAQDWLGVSTPEGMVDMLRKGGVPSRIGYERNQPSGILLDHVWVNAFVDVEPFRGSGEPGESEGDTWIPLDPSFKQHSFIQHDPAQALSLQPTALLINAQSGATVTPVGSQIVNVGSADQLQQSLLSEELVSQAEPLRNYLHQEELEAESVYWNRVVSDQRFGLFPITDEYDVVESGIVTRSVPEILTHRVELELDPGTLSEQVLSLSGSNPDSPRRLSEFAGDLITLSYEADQASKDFIDSHLADPIPGFDTDEAGAIWISPRLFDESDGAEDLIQTAGYSIPLGTEQRVEITYFEPGVESMSPSAAERMEHRIIAGGVHTFVFHHQHAPDADLIDAEGVIRELANDGLSSRFNDHEVVAQSVGRVLQAIGTNYYHQIDRYNQMNAGVFGVAATRMPSIACVSWGIERVGGIDSGDLDDGPVSFSVIRDVYSVTSRHADGGDVSDEAFGGDATGRFRAVSSILSNTVELSAIQQVLIALKGGSANHAVREANLNSPGDQVDVLTLASGADINALPSSVEDYVKDAIRDIAATTASPDIVRDGIELFVSSAPVSLWSNGPGFTSLHVFEKATGNNLIVQLNADTETETSALVPDGVMFDYDSDGIQDSAHEGVGFLNLIYFMDASGGTAHDPYKTVLHAGDDTLDFVEGAVDNTALWYLPAVANVAEWVESRQETDPVTLPLSTLMLSQPIDQFSTEPALIDFQFVVNNPNSDVWVGLPDDGDRHLLNFSGTALRSDGYVIEIYGPEGPGSMPILTEISQQFDFTGNMLARRFSDTQIAISQDNISDPVSGVHSYRVFSYLDDDGTDGYSLNDSTSVAYSGTFGVDIDDPTALISGVEVLVQDPNAAPPIGAGAVRVTGQVFDHQSFESGELRVMLNDQNPSGEVRDLDTPLYTYEFTEPEYVDDVLALIDTTEPPFFHQDDCRVILTARDSAWNEIEVTSADFTVLNPPDPDAIDITINGFEVFTITPTTQSLSGQTINQNFGDTIRPLKASVSSVDIVWPAPGEASAVGIERAEILVDERIIAEVPSEDLDEWLDGTTPEYSFDLPYSALGNGTEHDLVLRLTPNIGAMVTSAPVEFSSGDVFIRDFVVHNDLATRANPYVRVTASISSGSTTDGLWYLSLHSVTGAHNGQFLSLGNSSSTFVELDTSRYTGSGTLDLVSGADNVDTVPGGELPNNSQVEVDVTIDLWDVPLDDGPYWVQLIYTTTVSNNPGSGNSVWAQHSITIDMTNAPRAEIYEYNLANPADADDVDDLEFYLPTQVDSGFFDLAGYVYDLDPEQVGLEYRVEIRPVDQAVMTADRYDHPATDPPSWVAIPPEEGSSDTVWSVVPFTSTDADVNSWKELEGRTQFRPSDGGPFPLAKLDLTGLRDGEYEIGLVVRSDAVTHSDFGRLALSSPTKVGRFTFSQEDISLPSTGFPMSLVRTYDSLNAAKDGPFGLGWSMGIFDLEIEVHENREVASALYNSQNIDVGNSNTIPDVPIRNRQILDRSVSLTLPDGNRVTFPFYFRSGGAVSNLYPAYWPPPGYDNMTLEPLNTSDHIDTGLGILGLKWSSDPFGALEQHHDISGWKLKLEDGTEYTIRRVMLDDGFSFTFLGASQQTHVPTVWGDPYVSKIKLPDGDTILVDVDELTGEVIGFSVVPPDGTTGVATSELLRFVYENTGNGTRGRIIAAFGPLETTTVSDPENWDKPLYIYEYSENGQLTHVARVNEVDTGMDTPDETYQWSISDCDNDGDCDITTFTYKDTTSGVIESIMDPRGMQPAKSFYDDSGRLIATEDQYGRRVEISRDIENRTETVTDYGDVGDEPITTTYIYDEMGNVTREEHSSGKIVVREYDDENRLLLEQDLSRAQGTRYEYIDLQGSAERTRVTDPLGNVTETDQRITARGTPDYVITRQQMMGRDPIVTEQHFDHAGNLELTISGDTRIENEYDSKNRLIKTFMPAAGSGDGDVSDMVLRTEYLYDAEGADPQDPVNPGLLWQVRQYGEDATTGLNSVLSTQVFLYDDLGRQWASYTVSPDESNNLHAVADVQEYDYAGRVVATYRKIVSGSDPGLVLTDKTTWGARLSSTRYNSIDQAILTVDHVSDTSTTTLYDLRGNVLETARWDYDFLDAYITGTDDSDLVEILDWFEKPEDLTMGIQAVPTSFDTVSGGGVVTRTAYNGRGQAEYRTEPFYITTADYEMGTIPSELEITKTGYDADGRATVTDRVEGTITLSQVISDQYDFAMTATVGTETEPVSASEYDALGRVERTTSYNGARSGDDAVGVVTEYEYDENDRQVLVRVIGMGEGDSDLVTEYEYDEAGRQIATIDPIDNRIEYEYDEQGRRTRTFYEDPLHGTTSARSVYDSRGRRISEIDQEGRIRNFEYDLSDRLSSVTLLNEDQSAGNSVYGYEYDDRGNLLTITDPGDGETNFMYNHLGQRVSRTLPGNRTEQWAYYNDTPASSDASESFGKLRYHLDFVGNLTYHEYDLNGRLEYKRHYAGQGSTLPSSPPMGTPTRTYQYVYDQQGRVETITRSTGATTDRATGYVYDDFGRVIRLYQPEGIIVYGYDYGSGRLTQIRTFQGDNSNYDAVSEPNTNDLYATTNYAYDALGRLKAVEFVEGGVTRKWEYTFNSIGRRSGVEYKVGMTSVYATLYRYDTLGRLTALENRHGTVASPGDLVSGYYYTHDADGRRASVDEVLEEGTDQYSHIRVDYTYDSLARLVGEDSAGINNASGIDFIGPAPSPVTWVDHTDLAERQFSRTYTYNINGSREARVTDYFTGTDEHILYEYMTDSSDRLETMTVRDNDSQGTIVRVETYTYNDNGFMTKKLVNDDGAMNPDWTHTYTPDVEDRLSVYMRTDHNGTSGASVVYDYNSSGVRVQAGSRHFLIDSLNPTGYAQVIMERSASLQGTPVRHYAIGDDVLGETGASGYTYFRDGHGSTRQLMNGDGSGVAEDGVSQREQYYDYDAYGEAFGWALDEPDSGVSRPLTDMLYAGEQWDAELGMQYLRARYYLPEQGVFNRVDPFFGNQDDPQSLHKYAYVHGDPVNNIDPSGLVSISSLTTVAFGMSLINAFVSVAFEAALGENGARGVLAAGISAFVGSLLFYAAIPFAGPVAAGFVSSLITACIYAWMAKGESSFSDVRTQLEIGFQTIVGTVTAFLGRAATDRFTHELLDRVDNIPVARSQLHRLAARFPTDIFPRGLVTMADYAIANPSRLTQAFVKWFKDDLIRALGDSIKTAVTNFLANGSFALVDYLVDLVIRGYAAFTGFITDISNQISGDNEYTNYLE